MIKGMNTEFSSYGVIAAGLGTLGVAGAVVYALMMEPEAGVLVVLFAAPVILAAALLAYQGMRRRMLQTEKGVAEITSALIKIAEGDLTIKVPEGTSGNAK